MIIFIRDIICSLVLIFVLGGTLFHCVRRICKWRAGHLTPNLGDQGNKKTRTSCSNMFGLISVQAVYKCALRYIFVYHVTFCIWPGVSGYICAWQCSNDPMLSQHQLIVSKHFIKQKLIAFTSAEPTGVWHSIWGCGNISVKSKRLTQRDLF